MTITSLDQEFFAELSAFIANARKEGFSIKPSRIVKDKDYCSDVMNMLMHSATDELVDTALKIVSRCCHLSPETFSANLKSVSEAPSEAAA